MVNVPTRKVLFVDDEPHVLKALERAMFLHRDWEAATASGGEAALARLAKEHFDAVVSDMRMPGMDGATLLSLVLTRHPAIVRIVLSGHTELEAAMRAVPVAQQFLSKPCDTKVLVEVLDRTTRAGAAESDQRMNAVVGGIRRLPTRPPVYGALACALEDPRASIANLSAIVEKDAGISAKLLQLANSAFVGTHRRTSDLHAAVGFIGAQLLRTIVLSCEIFAAFDDGPEATWSSLAYQESLLMSAMLRKVAPAEVMRSGELITAAMLHDVGILVLAEAMPGTVTDLMRAATERKVGLDVAERAVIGFTHAQVGARLLTVWGIPSELVDLVLHHHEPWRNAGPARRQAAFLWAADRAARERLAPSEPPPFTDPELAFITEMQLEPALEACRAFAAGGTPAQLT